MARIDSFLKLVVEQKASDLHFHAGNRPLIRHDGDLFPLPFRVLTERECGRFLTEMLTDAQKRDLKDTSDLDFVYALEGIARFRVNIFRQQGGMAGVFRVVPDQPPSLDDLGMPEAIRRLTQLNNGFVLITGPTGSGKTTTLAAIVHEINHKASKHVITVEDPIEFVHESANSIVTQRQVGVHTKSFSGALRAALREAPDVLVVGEMRDLETVMLGVSAAETGILVFGTMHTNSAPKAIHRLIDMAPDESREHLRGVLSVLLRGVVAQHLCKRASDEGRIAAVEVLLQNYAVSNMIREDKVHLIESYLQSANLRESGMVSLENCLLEYARKGLVMPEEALKAANMPDLIRDRLYQLADNII